MLRHVVVRHPGTGAGRRSPPLPPNNANHCECARTLRGGFLGARREATPVLADSAASGQAVRAVRARLGAAANAAAPRSLRLVHPPVVVRATTGSAVVEVRAVTPRPTRSTQAERQTRRGTLEERPSARRSAAVRARPSSSEAERVGRDGAAVAFPTVPSPQHARGTAIWLILPVVICLSQRLSHACLSTYLDMVKLRKAH